MFLGVKLIYWILGGMAVFLVPVAFVGAVYAMAVMGSPDACDTGQRESTPPDFPLSPDLAAGALLPANAADAFQFKLDSLNARLDAGGSGEVSFSEAGIAARGQSWADDKGAPIKNIRVCIYADQGAASATVDAPGPDVDVLVTGTMDLSTNPPTIVVDDIEIGAMPGPLANVVEGIVERVVDSLADDINMEHRYSLTLREDEAQLSGSP